MGLDPGDIAATGGMSKAIYDALFNNMKGSFPDSKPSEDVCQSWKKLAYSIAFGVIEHIKSHMEIKGIASKWDAGTEMTGTTDTAEPDAHSHTLTLSVEEGSELIFPQEGTGYAE
jgi:hypothetical protein